MEKGKKNGGRASCPSSGKSSSNTKRLQGKRHFNHRTHRTHGKDPTALERRGDVPVPFRIPVWSKHLACFGMDGKRERAARCSHHSPRQTAPRHTDKNVCGPTALHPSSPPLNRTRTNRLSKKTLEIGEVGGRLGLRCSRTAKTEACNRVSPREGGMA